MQATDSAASQVSQVLSVRVEPDVKVSVTTTSLPTAHQNESYSDTLAATGGTLPYRWTVSAGALPQGLTLSSAGVVSGTPTASGTFSFSAEVIDSTSPTETATAQLMLNVPPVTSVLLPSTGATLQGTSTLDASASSQNGIGTVQFEISGGSFSHHVIGTGTGSFYGYLSNFDTTKVPDGSYSLQSVATDNGGLSTTSSPVTLTVSNPPPTTAVVIPATGSTQSGGTALLDAAAPTSVTSVTFELTGGTLNDQVVAKASPTIYGWMGQWNTTTVPNGTYTLQSVASYGGGVTGVSAPVTLSVNNPPPTTTVIIPATGSTQSGGTALLDAAAPTSVTSVTFELTGGTLNDQVVAKASPTIYGWVGQWNTTTVPNGTYTLQSVASYGGGVTGVSAPVTLSVNNPPPTTTVIIPATGSTQSGAAAVLDAFVSANVTSVSYQITGGTLNDQVVAKASPTIYGWVGQWNTTTVPNGTYTLQSVASYGGGVTGVSAPVNITVGN